jgi:hypothetical protein
MTNNKQQTAVEWYHQQIVDRQNGNGDSRSLDEIFEQAKEIEKEQIKNAHNEGYGSGYMDDLKSPEQYYNETYGGNK